jgi:glycosyltransferase involved in cell wall biosynthesis
MGKPVVATKAGEVNFAVENKINGFLCKEGKIEDYVSALDTLLKDQSLRKSFGNAARSKAINELSWEANIDRIFNFISYLDTKK